MLAGSPQAAPPARRDLASDTKSPPSSIGKRSAHQPTLSHLVANISFHLRYLFSFIALGTTAHQLVTLIHRLPNIHFPSMLRAGPFVTPLQHIMAPFLIRKVMIHKDADIQILL